MPSPDRLLPEEQVEGPTLMFWLLLRFEAKQAIAGDAEARAWLMEAGADIEHLAASWPRRANRPRETENVR